jgi:hypothetical protein
MVLLYAGGQATQPRGVRIIVLLLRLADLPIPAYHSSIILIYQEEQMDGEPEDPT